MTSEKLDKAIDGIQSALTWFVILVITICIGVLFLFDVLAGTGTMLYLTNGKEWQSFVISLSTTGLLFSLMFIGYLMITQKSEVLKSVGVGVFIFASAIYIMDIAFDALLADILRYETIMFMDVDSMQWCFRILLGGISTVGDALAIAMIMGMPVLKQMVGNALGSSHVPIKQVRNEHHGQQPSYQFRGNSAQRKRELERIYQSNIDHKNADR